MMGGIKGRNGFTIVELLIVIAVIAILAALVIVAYNGIQQRARIATTRAEMLSVGKSTEIFRVQHNRSPSTATEFSSVLKEANLYNSTRTTDKSYAICADTLGYAFVAWSPMVESYKNGDTLYLYASNGGQQIFELPNSSLSSANQLDKICDQVYEASIFDAWTYDIP
jgi:prepilin-type N-terminal cleavage/methylation domain-containing protein